MREYFDYGDAKAMHRYLELKEMEDREVKVYTVVEWARNNEHKRVV